MNPTIARICAENGVSAASVLGVQRSKDLVRVRRLIIDALHREGLSSGQTGRLINRDGSTVREWLGR